MTNEQLAILIRAWASRLEREIDLVAKELPDELKEDKLLLSVTLKTYPVLFGLSGLANEMNEAVKYLASNQKERRLFNEDDLSRWGIRQGIK